MSKIFFTKHSSRYEIFNPLNRQNELISFTPGNPDSENSAQQKFDTRCQELFDTCKKRLGRNPTQLELSRGRTDNAFDSRTVKEMQIDAEFQVKLRTSISPEEQHALDAENEVERIREEEAVRKMTREERLAYFARDRADRIVAESEGKTSAELVNMLLEHAPTPSSGM